ncbi:sigma-54-dependent transcriptional regulator [Thiolapillus brandeum]|uniref:Two-component system NtrC family response regulator PilR n=1 Tax=Thiolapillus brandeum TaxID=1076588 RepID=A0A7U6JIG2_9GAMM|nr:sigma-54 dependent transcriptional regulator [Thiolapillus brandeum]BAO45276.1 two-component system NtrC family response regulator PilR [Thiolapillus brandeum]
MDNPTALIVDDEPDIRELLELTLQRMDIDTVTAADLGQARNALATRNFQLCLADMRLPDGDGIDLVREIHEEHPGTPVAMITAHGNMETAIQALKAGAFDFVSKPVDLSVLRNLVVTALKLQEPGKQQICEDDQEDSQCPLRGASAAMDKVRSLISKLARSQAPVHITGESGTGKELAARLIHQLGPRNDNPFVAVNCGAIPHELMESELFGYKKGAFTGAVADKTGLFVEANGGTLFLDEVADLPLSMQVKLLRVIQEKMVRPVGATEELPINVRIISATHQNLAQRVQEEAFRQDLYYRLNVIELHMPSLRERPEDIPGLTQHLLENIASNYQQPVPELQPAALDALQHHPFPGNVRELENILERAFALCDDGIITLDDLGMLDLSVSPETGKAGQARLPGENLEDYLARIEKDILLEALEETGGNKTSAASRLGISFRSFRYRLGKLGIAGKDDEK